MTRLITQTGTAPCLDGLGYPRTPGIYRADMVQQWGHVTSAVHAQGSSIVCQLLHTGRISHPSNAPAASARCLAPSPVAARGTIFTEASGLQPLPQPLEMTQEDIDFTGDNDIMRAHHPLPHYNVTAIIPLPLYNVTACVTPSNQSPACNCSASLCRISGSSREVT